MTVGKVHSGTSFFIEFTTSIGESSKHDELFLNIFSYFDTRDYGRSMGVCTGWRWHLKNAETLLFSKWFQERWPYARPSTSNIKERFYNYAGIGFVDEINITPSDRYECREQDIKILIRDDKMFDPYTFDIKQFNLRSGTSEVFITDTMPILNFDVHMGVVVMGNEEGHIIQYAGVPLGGEITEECHGSAITCISLGEDWILSGSCDGSVKVWDRESGWCRMTVFQFFGPIASIAKHGNMLAFASAMYGNKKTLYIMRLEEQSLDAILDLGHKSSITALAFHANLLVSCSCDAIITTDLASYTRVNRIASGSIEFSHFAIGEGLIVASDRRGRVQIFDIASGLGLKEFQHASNVESVAIQGDVVLAHLGTKIVVHKVKRGK